MTLLLIGVPYELNSLGTFPGTPVAMPARRVQLTLQSSFDSAPSGVDVDLEGSNDNVDYFPIDNANFSETGGEIITINTSAQFIRLNGSVTGGTGPSFLVVAKA